MLTFDTTLAERSARYLAFLTALNAPATPNTPENARSAELARILAFDIDRLGEIVGLSDRLLFERDFAAGCEPGVAYGLDDLANHFETDRATLLSAAKLCGALPFQRGGKTVWIDHEGGQSRLTLDKAAILDAEAKRPGIPLEEWEAQQR